MVRGLRRYKHCSGTCWRIDDPRQRPGVVRMVDDVLTLGTQGHVHQWVKYCGSACAEVRTSGFNRGPLVCCECICSPMPRWVPSGGTPGADGREVLLIVQVSRTSPRGSSGDDALPALELSPDAGTSSPTPGLHVRVLLVEEYGLVRRGLQLQLEADAKYEVCGGVRNPAEAVAGLFAPDLVVSELLFHEVQGPPVVARFRNAFPEASILVLTRVGNPAYVHLALDAGANGYILKDAPPEDFLLAVHRVAGRTGVRAAAARRSCGALEGIQPAATAGVAHDADSSRGRGDRASGARSHEHRDRCDAGRGVANG